MIARKPLMLAFAILAAWLATCLVAVVIAPMPEVAIGLSEGAIWFERSTIGDPSPGAFIRAGPSPRRFAARHRRPLNPDTNRNHRPLG